MERVQAEQQKQLSWLEPHLAKPFPLQWLPLDWIGEGCMIAPVPHSTGMDDLDLLSSELQIWFLKKTCQNVLLCQGNKTTTPQGVGFCMNNVFYCKDNKKMITSPT